METPLEIAFHQITPSAALESFIRERVAKLEKLCPRMVSCRVSVEAQHRSHRQGNVPDVHIEIGVPGDTIVISHSPHHPKARHADPTFEGVTRDAFHAAETRLKDFRRH